MSNMMNRREKKEDIQKLIETDRNNESNISRLNKNNIYDILRYNDIEKKTSQKKKNIYSNNNMSYTSRLNYNKDRYDDSMNNIIFENSCISSLNNNSKYISLNNSQSIICKKLVNKSSSEISDENNSDVQRFFKKYKFYPLFKNSSIRRSKENSDNASCSNTKPVTPRSKKQNSYNHFHSII